MIASVMFARNDVSLSSESGAEPPLCETKTSKHVTRLRCATCFTPVLAILGPSRCVVPLSLFERPPEEWAPQHHMHYDCRVIDVADKLPKYRTNFGGETCSDNGGALPA